MKPNQRKKLKWVSQPLIDAIFHKVNEEGTILFRYRQILRQITANYSNDW